MSFSPTGLREAERLLLEGLKVAGENALLLAGLGRVHFEHVNAALEGEESLEEAEAFARRALALDAECGPALLVLGLVQHFRGDLAETVRLLKRALQSDPNDGDTLWWLAWFNMWLIGQPGEAMRVARRHVDVDPGNPMSQASVAWVLFIERRFDEALAAAEPLPDHVWFRFIRALILSSAGRDAEALSLLEPVEPEEETTLAGSFALFLKFALRGERHRFPEVLRPEYVRLAELDACTAAFFAMFHSLAGDTEAALGWLEKAVPRGYFNYPFLCTHDRFTAPLRGHPRFERLLDEMKRKWEAFREEGGDAAR